MGATDDAAPVEHGDRPVQVKVGPQYLRVGVKPVAVGPGLHLHPFHKFRGGYLPQFQHPEILSKGFLLPLPRPNLAESITGPCSTGSILHHFGGSYTRPAAGHRGLTP